MEHVWLVRSKEYDKESFWEVFQLLNSFPGPIKFFTNEEPISISDEKLEDVLRDSLSFTFQKTDPFSKYERIAFQKLAENPLFYKRASWEDLFRVCKEFRAQHDIIGEQFVIFLTDHLNEYNWFAGGDPNGEKNLFVHTAFWEEYTGSDRRFPVAYHIASSILTKLSFDDYTELKESLHLVPRGCIHDFCIEKKDISLKLRTADICDDCMEILHSRQVDQALIRQVLVIIEGIREQMLFKNRWLINPVLLRLQISEHTKNLSFPELGDLEIKLTPLEKALYLLFLKYPSGIRMVELSDYTPELKQIYNQLYVGSDPNAIDENINGMVNPLGNSASEKISKIKSKFIHGLGEKMATYYYPKGERNEPRLIQINRNLVDYL